MARLPGLVAGNVLDLGRAAASRLRPEETTAMDGRHAPPREDRGRRSEGGRKKRQPATTDPAPSSEVFVAGRFTLRKRLRVSDNWVATHAPQIQQLDVGEPQLTPAAEHARRRLSAIVRGPDEQHSLEVDEVHPPRAPTARAPLHSSLLTPSHVGLLQLPAGGWRARIRGATSRSEAAATHREP